MLYILHFNQYCQYEGSYTKRILGIFDSKVKAVLFMEEAAKKNKWIKSNNEDYLDQEGYFLTRTTYGSIHEDLYITKHQLNNADVDFIKMIHEGLV